EIARVYNLRISDYHTYFVGCEEWGFSVWAHNACNVTQNRINGNAFRDKIADLFAKAGYTVKTEVYRWTPLGKRYIDILLSKGGKVIGGIETKLGGSPYKPMQR